MAIRPTHHRAKHRSRLRRLALPAALVFGLTLASQCSNPIDSAIWSLANAPGPTPTKPKVQPKIVDFTKLAKLKAEARRLMESAKSAAAKGDLENAQRLAVQAAAIPVEWNLTETSPQKFMDELQADPQKFAEPADIEVTRDPRNESAPMPQRQRRHHETIIPPSRAAGDREVIELAFPDDRDGNIDISDEDLTLTDASTTSKGQSVGRLRAEVSDAPKNLRSLGFRSNEPALVASESKAATPRKAQRFAPIPSLEELADTAPAAVVGANESDPEAVSAFKRPTSASMKRSSLLPLDAPRSGTNTRGSFHATQSHLDLNPRHLDGNETSNREQVKPVEETVIRQLINAEDAMPVLRQENLDTEDSGSETRTQSRHRALLPPTSAGMPTTVIHEFRGVERADAGGQAASLNAASASQFLMTLNGLMMAGLFGTLLLLIVVAVVVLRKFGPNPQFTFKVELSHPNGTAAANIASGITAPVAPVVPVLAIKRQLEDELALHQDDAMMRQVFEENLKLREQLDEGRIAA